MSNLAHLPEWVVRAQHFPLRFAQVREDPLLDESLLNLLKTKNARVLMIASGGCTASYLASLANVAKLDLVDSNLSQLTLTRIKLEMLKTMQIADRLQILGHAPMKTSERKRWLAEWLENHGLAEDTFGEINCVAELGLDYCGRYEMLFQELQKSFSFAQKQILISACEAQNGAGLNFLKSVFEKVMSLENLVALFSSSATQNPFKPFSQHFYDQTIKALCKEDKSKNPYLYQVLFGHYNEGNVIPWLHLKPHAIRAEINYKNVDMLTALKETTEKYDMIHLSNILDWLTVNEAETLLEFACKRLNNNGVVMIRQLNSNLNIRQLNSGLTWLAGDSECLLKQDRSFFYRDIHVGQYAV